MKYLKLIRFVNLIIIAATLLVFKFFIIDYYYTVTALSTINFYILVMAIICIAAAGYVINDIEDVKIDLVNKPNKVLIGKVIDEKTANYLFIILNVMGMGSGFYLSYAVGQPNYAMIFVFSSGVLYLYATRLKYMLVVSNLIVSLLTAVCIITLGVYTILPIYAQDPTYQDLNQYVFMYLLTYAGFAFITNLLRELVKDAEDIEGDTQYEVHSIPIALGLKKTGILTGVLTLLLVAGIFWISYSLFFNSTEVITYIFIALLAPLLFTAIKAFTAKEKKDFKLLKTLYKIVMVTGIASAYVIYLYVLKP